MFMERTCRVWSLKPSLLLGAALLFGAMTAGAQTAAATGAAGHATPHTSSVLYDHGSLTVRATNSSLNSLLREIARKTGMSVTGSVAEDRVFGTYGPADPQRVLALLLDGSGSNFLIRSSAADASVQLILTRRSGAVTPPDPNAAAAQEADDDDADTVPPVGAPRSRSGFPASTPVSGGVPNAASQGSSAAPQSGSQPASPDGTPAAQPSATSGEVAFPPVGAGAAPATGSTTPAATDGSAADSVKTPQQIFEQLQRLQQQGTRAPQ